MLSNVNKKCDDNLILLNTYNTSLILKFSWEMLFFEGRDTEVFKAARNKLFASNENRFDNHTFMLDMLH